MNHFSYMHRKEKKAEAGFTLVETLIAIAVLLLAVAGPLTIAARGLISAAFARDQVTAFYLAQEATEYVRNMRDNNALSGNAWTSGFEECIGKTCIIDATEEVGSNDSIVECSVTCPPLQKDSVSGLYGYSVGWSNSKFTRSVSMTQIGDDELELSVSISWNNGPLNKTLVVQENLRDWQ